MAKKYYRINAEKKIITINDDVTPTKNDREDVQMYVSGGYKIKHTKSISVEGMRAEMGKDKDNAKDKKALEEFNAAYAEKGGFHKACKIYSAWKKEKKTAEKAKKAE